MRIPFLTFTLLLSAIAAAVDTDQLRLGTDGVVTLTRDGDDLVFDDGAIGPITLEDLAAPASDHGALTGLLDDDHPQYLDDTRHVATHDAAFNDALPISADVGGNETLGDHAADAQIHLRRDIAEAVDGIWNFENSIQLGDTLLISGAVGISEYGIEFTSSWPGDTPAFQYDSDLDVFELNRDLLATGFAVGADRVDAQTFRVLDDLAIAATWTSANGSPEGVVTAPVGSLYSRRDGGTGTTLYVKESGSGNTGWTAK